MESKVKLYPEAMTAKELKAKVLAFETLFDAPAAVKVRGDWYGPIDGEELPGFSIHNGMHDFRVISIGRKYVEIELSERGQRHLHKVLITEKRGNGAYRVTIEVAEGWMDNVKINGKRRM